MSPHELAGWLNPDRDDRGWVGAPADDDLEQRLAAEDEPFDERQPHVMTALGAISPTVLGVTLFGSWDRPLLAPGRVPGAVLVEAERLYATGVHAVVELAAASDQQLADLAWISRRSPIHLVFASGPTPATVTSDEPLRFGITRVESLPAPGEAAARPDRPPFVRAETWSAAAQLATPHGGAEHDWTGWTVVAEPANATSSLVRAVLAAGASLVLIVADADSGAMAGTAALIRELVELGYGNRLSLGYNADPVVVIERLPLFLMDAGLPAIAVRRILVDNPAEVLTTQTRQP